MIKKAKNTTKGSKGSHLSFTAYLQERNIQKPATAEGLVIVKKSSPHATVGRLATARPPTDDRQVTDSFPKQTFYCKIEQRKPDFTDIGSNIKDR